jgi:hypothetical protein
MNDFERIVVTELGFLIEIEERAEGQVKGLRERLPNLCF